MLRTWVVRLITGVTAFDDDSTIWIQSEAGSLLPSDVKPHRIQTESGGAFCNASGAKPTVTHFRLYHISKCGGSTINRLFAEGGLTKGGAAAWLGEAENSCDHLDKCKYSDSVFVIGLVRSPFSYYMSWWHQIAGSNPNPYNYACIGKGAATRGLYDIFDKKNINNRTTFERFLRYYIVDAPKSDGNTKGTYCDFTLSGVYKSLLLTPEQTPRYDAIVAIEDFWHSLEQAMRRIECALPNTFDWEFFDWVSKAGRPQGDHTATDSKRFLAYQCFYTDYARHLVEEHDQFVMQRHGYSFEKFMDAKYTCMNVIGMSQEDL